jgi:hypothetical protein
LLVALAAAGLLIGAVAATRANVFAFATGHLYTDTQYAGAAKDARESGHSEGYSAGQSAGFDSGYSAGQSAGYESGYAEGKSAQEATDMQPGSAPYQAGYEAGKSHAESANVGHDYDAGYADGVSCAATSSDPYLDCNP